MSTTTAVNLPSGTLHIRAQSPCAWPLEQLCGFASRQNPKRAFLFVSKVLGKHIPARPSQMKATHDALAAALQACVPAGHKTLMLGFAETATGLGAGVFEAFLRLSAHTEALYMQTTRYELGQPVALRFLEEHSHATGHLVYEPRVRKDVFYGARTLVLVDDELTTGQTNQNFLKAFLTLNAGISQVVLVSLVNWMSPGRREQFAAQFPGLQVQFCSLHNGEFTYAPAHGFICPAMPKVEGNTGDKSELLPHDLHRFGCDAPMQVDVDAVLARVPLRADVPVHVVGDGEFMHAAFRLGLALEQRGYAVHVQSTTRSPVLVGNAIAARLSFCDHYDDGIPNYLYNAPAPGAQVLLVHESTGPLHLLEQLRATPIHLSALTPASTVKGLL